MGSAWGIIVAIFQINRLWYTKKCKDIHKKNNNMQIWIEWHPQIWVLPKLMKFPNKWKDIANKKHWQICFYVTSKNSDCIHLWIAFCAFVQSCTHLWISSSTFVAFEAFLGPRLQTNPQIVQLHPLTTQANQIMARLCRPITVHFPKTVTLCFTIGA